VLDVPLRKLPGGSSKNLGSRDIGPRHHQRHDILQLIPESVRARTLVERRTGPDAA
jgi:hypothetical protein